MKHNIPAVIFAGGKSSRMKKDKSLLSFGNFPTLSEFQHHRLSKIFKEVYISTKKNKFDFSAEVIEDLHKESSPLIALISVLETLDTDKIFVLSVDAPFVDEKVIDELCDYRGSADAVIAKSPYGTEPLCGIYNKSILPLAKLQLKESNHQLNALLKKAKTQLIAFDDHAPFMNINHPNEYEDALKLILP